MCMLDLNNVLSTYRNMTSKYKISQFLLSELFITPRCCSAPGCTSDYNPFHRYLYSGCLINYLNSNRLGKDLRYENIDHFKVFNVCIRIFEMKMWISCISDQMETVHSLIYLSELKLKDDTPCLVLSY